MQRNMKAQTLASGGDAGMMDNMNKAILKINPNHPIVQELDRRVRSQKEAKETEDYALLMYDVASMTGGYEVSDMGSFAKRVMSMMTDEELPVSKPSVTEDDTDDDDDDVEAVEPEVFQ